MKLVASSCLALLCVASSARGQPAPPATSSWSISGYLQAQYTLAHDTNDDGTEANDALALRRVRVTAAGQVVDRVGFKIMFDPSTASNLLRDGYLTAALPRHEVRIGQQKTQFGYENPESSTKLFTINRALVSDRLGRGADLRDIGLGVLGEHPLPGGATVDYQLTVVNGAGTNVTKDDTDDPTIWLRAGGSYGATVVTAHAGVSFAAGDRLDVGDPLDPMDDAPVDFTRLGADVRVEHVWFVAIAEAAFGTDETAAAATDALGFYATVIGVTAWKAGPIVRYDWFDPDLDAAGDGFARVTAGAYYDVSGRAMRLIANYEANLSQGTGRDDAFLLWAQAMFK